MKYDNQNEKQIGWSIYRWCVVAHISETFYHCAYQMT